MEASEQYRALVTGVATRGGADEYYLLGCYLNDTKQWGAAAGCFAKVVSAQPLNHRALCNLGWSWHLAGRSEEAVEALERSIALAPGEAMPRALLAQVLMVLGEDERALLEGMEAVRLGPQDALNHVAASFVLINAGDYRRGWQENEWRMPYKIPELFNRPYRLWRGEWVEHLYLEAEQGSGDSIMAFRWVPEAAKRVGRITLFLQKELYGLAMEGAGFPENVSVFPLPRPLPAADAFSPLMSLPVAMEVGEVEPVGPYLRVGERVERNKVVNVGICWAGNVSHEQSHHRDIPLPYMLRLAEVGGVKLHSLQLGTGQEQFGQVAAYGLIEDRAPEILSFLDTAKIMVTDLDLVISVDTSVAHLAGALGVPNWLLLNQRGRDFRYGSRGNRSRWYASQTVYRRQIDEDWGALIGRAALDLKAVAP